MLLAVCISIIVVLILYLFYWNRLVAYLIGLFFRLLYWKPSNSRVWVEIGTTSDVSLVLSAPILTSSQALSISPCWRVGYSSRTCDITPAIRPSKSPKASSPGRIGFVTQLHSRTSAIPVSMEGTVRNFTTILTRLLCVYGHNQRNHTPMPADVAYSSLSKALSGSCITEQGRTTTSSLNSCLISNFLENGSVLAPGSARIPPQVHISFFASLTIFLKCL